MGKLNILKHKSWNPYSRENKEKVRQDEEQAARERLEKEQRATAAVRRSIQDSSFGGVTFILPFFDRIKSSDYHISGNLRMSVTTKCPKETMYQL